MTQVLYDLLAAISSTEKKSFIASQGIKQSKVIDLYKLLNENIIHKGLTEKALLHKQKNNPLLTKHFAKNKNYLHAILLNKLSLQHHHKENIENFKSLLRINYLYEKGLLAQSQKLCNKEFKDALSKENFHLALILCAYKQKIDNNYSTGESYSESFKKLKRNHVLNRQILTNLHLIDTLTRVDQYYNLLIYDRAIEEINFNHIINFLKKIEDLNTSSKTIFYFLHSSYMVLYTNLHQQNKCYNHSKKIVQSMMDNIEFWKSSNIHNFYLSLLSHIFLCIRMEKKIEANEYLNILYKEIDTLKKNNKIFAIYILQKILYENYFGSAKTGLQLFNEHLSLEYINKAPGYIKHQSFFIVALSHFLNKDYSQSLKYVNHNIVLDNIYNVGSTMFYGSVVLKVLNYLYQEEHGSLKRFIASIIENIENKHFKKVLSDLIKDVHSETPSDQLKKSFVQHLMKLEQKKQLHSEIISISILNRKLKITS